MHSLNFFGVSRELPKEYMIKFWARTMSYFGNKKKQNFDGEMMSLCLFSRAVFQFNLSQVNFIPSSCFLSIFHINQFPEVSSMLLNFFFKCHIILCTHVTLYLHFFHYCLSHTRAYNSPNFFCKSYLPLCCCQFFLSCVSHILFST